MRVEIKKLFWRKLFVVTFFLYVVILLYHFTKPVVLLQLLTLKHRETHGCVVSTVATDALVLKHQAISILSTD